MNITSKDTLIIVESNQFLTFVIFNDLPVPELALCVQKELCSAIPEAEQGRLVASQI